MKTTNTTIEIKNIVNGAQYVARVSAYVKNYTGRSQSLILKRTGEPLPEVPNIQTSREEENIRLSWSNPKVPLPASAKIIYGIYYGTNLEDLFDVPKHKTEAKSFLLDDLYECQSYLIGVGIIGPIGPGPLRRDPLIVETHFSERKPPKNLSVSFDDARHTMEISWEHSCSLTSNRYPNYIVRQLYFH